MKKYFYLPIILAFLLSGSNSSTDQSLCEDLNTDLIEFQISDFQISDSEDPESSLRCCKICRKGKACGDTCINKSYNCTKGPGCACNG